MCGAENDLRPCHEIFEDLKAVLQAVSGVLDVAIAWNLAATTRNAAAKQHEMAERSQALQWIAGCDIRFDETLRDHINENP